jgi:hypothetical protein
MLQKSTKIIAIISTCIFVACIIILVGFSIIVDRQKTKYIEMNHAHAESKSHHESIEKLTRVLEETQDDRAMLISRVLKEEGVIDLLSLIESVGKEQGVELKTNSLNVAAIGKNEFFETVIVNLNIKGSYASVIRVLKLLEHLPYQSIVSSIHMNSEEWDSSIWYSTLELRVTKFKKI